MSIPAVLLSRHAAAFWVLFFTLTAAAQKAVVRPRPLDPLTVAETERAVAAARADARVRELLTGSRHRLILVELWVTKPAEQAETAAESPQAPRQAEVLFYRYEGHYGVHALVDVGAAKVLEVDRVPGNEVPFSPEETEEARTLALRNKALTAKLAAPLAEVRVEYLPVRTDDKGDPCSAHRCLQLLFRKGRGFLIEPVVIVDLTEQTMRMEGGER